MIKYVSKEKGRGKNAETRRNLHTHTHTHTHTTKALLVFFLVFAIIPSFAQHPRITQLIAEKQAKMEKLEKCQGTTKKLKIAGISTLGVTAVGVGANIAEAVILKDKESKIATAKEELTKQQEQKEKRECEKEDSNKEYKDGKCECIDGYSKNENGNCVKEQKQQEPGQQVNASESCQYTATNCAGYVGEVYNCVKKGGKCFAYSDMDICSAAVIGNIDNPSNGEWLKKAETVCEENKIKKKELENTQNKIDDITDKCKITYKADAVNPVTNACIYNKLVINTNFNDAAGQFLSEKKWTIGNITCDNVNKRCRDSKQEINIDFNTVECADKNAKYDNKNGTCACNVGYIKDESSACYAVDDNRLTNTPEESGIPAAQPPVAEKNVERVVDDNRPTNIPEESGKPAAQPPVADTAPMDNTEYLYFKNRSNQCYKANVSTNAYNNVSDCSGMQGLEWRIIKGISVSKYGKVQCGTEKSSIRINLNSQVSGDACVCLVGGGERMAQGLKCDQIECAMACANQ